MFTSIMGVGSPAGLGLLIMLLALVVIAYRFLRRSTDIDPIHKGKAPAQCCKFDRAEVVATRFIVPPPLILPALGPADPRVQAAMNAVQVPAIKGTLDGLTGEVAVSAGGRSGLIASRNSFGKDIDLALAYLEEFYRGLGLQTVREPYTARGKTYFNLVATQPGKVSPDRVLIIGAHLDSTAGRPSSTEKVAPGADDDGSGTVSLMEIAKALTKLPLGVTVRYVHFTGEEQGLWGSYSYSDKVAEAKTNLVAMIQLDMVGWCAKPGNRLDIHDGKDRNGSHALVGYFVANVSRYGLALRPVDTHNHAVDNRSDHAGFHDHGYKAVLLSEEFTDDGFNPNYHSVSDKANTLNFPYLVEVIKLTIATAADLAQIQP
ncbi:MAG: M28 family peptidase [Candidatus Melainabacteria bacterium]|nr:M28 family peptidase [Candidatus Melainabacteria bacterium]